jgi:hypothetical protein
MYVWTLRRSALTGGGTKGACREREKLYVCFSLSATCSYRTEQYIDTDRFLIFKTNASLDLGQRSSCDRVPDGKQLDEVKTEPNKSRVDPSIEIGLVLKAQNR